MTFLWFRWILSKGCYIVASLWLSLLLSWVVVVKCLCGALGTLWHSGYVYTTWTRQMSREPVVDLCLLCSSTHFWNNLEQANQWHLSGGYLSVRYYPKLHMYWTSGYLVIIMYSTKGRRLTFTKMPGSCFRYCLLCLIRLETPSSYRM